MIQRMDWDRFEESIKTRSRFFSRTAATYHASVFDGIDGLRTRSCRPLVVKGGPGASFHMLYRARAFEFDDKLEATFARPDIHLGPPPAPLAGAAE